MKNCANCRSQSVRRFMDLGQQPNGNTFPTADEFEDEPFFPFSMGVCTECWQVQLEEAPSAEFMFANHPYITGVNMPVVSHFDAMVTDVLEKIHLPRNSLVLDIGANDGTLLQRFRDRGMRVIGVDPGSRTGRLAKENGVTVCETFWNEETAGHLAALKLRPKLITATAVFYHIEDIHSFVRGLLEVMDNDTVFLTQCVYMKDVLEKLQFDHFYHEHTLMHHLMPLQRLFAEYGLKMIDVVFYPVHGGSFALYVAKEEAPYEIRPSVERALAAEREAGLDQIETYHSFSSKVEANRDELVCLLRELRSKGKRIYGLGAPLKGSTLLNYCGIGPDLVECCTEVNRFKIGKFTPGTHIPIIYEEEVDEQPDYYLVLSWNFLDFFVDKYADFLLRGGCLIVPHPEVTIIDKSVLSK